MVAGILLRILTKRMGIQGVARAFAHDTAIALKDACQFDTIVKLFDDYAAVSNSCSMPRKR